MVVGEASIHNIMGGMESTGGVRLHNHKRKLKQRFDIIKKLGQGTYGKVQLGINKETGQEVAIKTIKKCKIETEADLIRIRREIQIMSSVQHPNIIHIYEVFENREKMVLVMEYAAGGELYDYLSERKVLTEQEARRIFRQIATAVFYCHKHKICHRDLKLENILLDQVGNAKIADFGLSNVFDEQRLLSTFCGSPLYASPEIVKGTPYHGPEVDCWSLGVLLYTLVYGAMPFDGSNFKRLVKQISQSDYFEPKKPSPASPLIKDMLTVCPARRADIERICAHWWVNEGYEQNCLDIAEDLAAQTPVRLDLLLSLVPQSASAEKLLVGDQQAGGDVAAMSSETLVPTRCHSVGSLMELDQNSSDRRIRELFEEEPRMSAAGDAKRKLETTPSMDETAAAGVKRKERSRRKERTEEREPRAYRSTSRHHSAPIPNSITEEAMEVDPAATVTVPTSKTADLNKVEAAAACLELIEECKEKSPSKERSRTPVASESEQVPKEVSMENVAEECGVSVQRNKEESQGQYVKSLSKSTHDDVTKPSEGARAVNKLTNEDNAAEAEVPNESDATAGTEGESGITYDVNKVESADRNVKKLKEKALSLDETSNETPEVPAKTVERRRSKIFETAEKFNQLASNSESDKPKKIFIPGVNVGGAKRVFERKASLSSVNAPTKANASKVIIDVPTDKKNEKADDKTKASQEAADAEEKLKKEEAKKRAVDIITGAIGKPPVQRKLNGSPPISPQTQDPKKLGLKIQVGPNDIRSATVSVSTPVDTKFPFDNKSLAQEPTVSDTPSTLPSADDSQLEEPKMSSKMEITLKSATLPRPRKTSKAEITLSGIKSPEATAFKSEVEAKIDAFQPQKLRTQRSEVAFPVAAAVPQANRSSSLEPETRPRFAAPKERIIPIQVEPGHQASQHASTPPPKPPMPQRSMSQRSASLSRQSTADSDTDSALGSTVGPEPIRKSPREYIIPIAVEGGGYVTPRSGSVEPESKTSTPTSTNAPRSRFGRPRRMSSFLSDASEDESPFSSLHRDSEDLLQRHMHRLRSSRPSRQPPEHADSLSSGEDDDDDGFELLTAENLFSTLLSRVRSLTQRLNVDDNRGSGFPSSRLFGRLGTNSPQAFWGLNKPLSRRLSESQFKHSLSRDADMFATRKDSAGSTNPGSPNSPGSHSNPSRESVFDIGSNTLPRDKIEHEDVEAETAQIRKEAQESLEQNFTPSLARRLSRQFVDQARHSLPRSPSVSREKYYQSPTRETLSMIDTSDAGKRHTSSTTSDQTEYRGRSAERNIRRTNSLLEAGIKMDKLDHRSPRRSISLFDEEDRLLPPLPRQVMTLGRKYKESGKSSLSNARKDNLYRTEKIQEEPFDETTNSYKENGGNADNHLDNGSTSECTSLSVCNSTTNLVDTTSSVSAKSYETESPTESSSNINDYSKPGYRCDASRNFESRLLAAENLIKESKLRNLGPAKFNPNLTSSYKDTDKCDKESLISMSDTTNTPSKRRSCIPSLRLRSGSLSREPSVGAERRKSFANSQDALGTRSATPERSILSKLFRAGGSAKEGESKEREKPRQHRISRFLRPDFFDTPREESQYVKEKEAQKAAENERRKSRFMKKRNESKAQMENDGEGKVEKELKNEMNLLRKDSKSADASSEDKLKRDNACDAPKLKYERQNSKNSFLHSLEKRLEKFRSGEETTKPVANGGISSDQKIRALRETSAPPAECLCAESNSMKKAISVEDLSLSKAPASAPKSSRVSSVLGLFKNTDGKQSGNGSSRAQNVILSKLKRSPPKLTKEVSPTEEVPSTSKIPKSSKNDVKSVKKVADGKSSPEKIVTDVRKPLIKEKSKEREIGSREKKTVAEKRTKEMMKKTTEKSVSETSSSNVDPPVEKEKIKRLDSPTKTDDTKQFADETEIVQKVADNKQLESVGRNEDKKLMKTKKNVSSLTKGNSKSEKSDEADRKVKKVMKTKTGAEKDEGEGQVKKKKIVRVVKKVVKKSSDSSDSRADDKEKSGKSAVKKGVTSKKETSPDATTANVVSKTKSKENNSEPQTVLKSTSNHAETKSLLPKELDTFKNSKTEEESKPKSNTAADPASMKSDLSKPVDTKDVKLNPVNENNIVGSPTDSNTFQPKSNEQQRANRSSLKLDLSKIPQHTFRNTTPKRDSPRSEVAKEKPQESRANVAGSETTPDKVIESLSKMTHHANITGNKIVIDKPLRAKDVAELKKEVSECARIIENHIECHHEGSTSQAMLQAKSNAVDNSAMEKPLGRQESIIAEQSDVNTLTKADSDSEKNYRESPSDRNDAFSPVEEPESFDSWSICSADLNHTRGDLNSPTSPSYSLFSRDDQPESIIDRIRRRSFYSRFNDRKRPSLTAPPPGITLPTSTSLPRKYSFSSSRDRSRSKLSNYVSPRSAERNYGLYNDDMPSYRKSPVEKERYTDIASSYGGDRRSPIEHYGSSYDPLRKYLKSPTLDLCSSRRRYHSTDFSTDSELGSYRSPLSSSLLSDNPMESYVGKSSCTLPRKYGSSVGNTEPKSVEYYEELLAPSNPEYLMPKSPSSHEYLGRCENGYHNGNLDLPQFNADKRKSYANKLADMEFTERERELGEQKRSTSRQRVSETKDLPTTSSEAQSNPCTAE